MNVQLSPSQARALLELAGRAPKSEAEKLWLGETAADIDDQFTRHVQAEKERREREAQGQGQEQDIQKEGGVIPPSA